MDKKGMSKTAFIILSIVIGFGILSTTVLAFFTGKPLGTMTIGYLIFGILAGILMVILSDENVNYKLDDDLKITFNRTVKHIYPKNGLYSPTEDNLGDPPSGDDFPEDEFINENDDIEKPD